VANSNVFFTGFGYVVTVLMINAV